jgi:hypothetical protein
LSGVVAARVAVRVAVRITAYAAVFTGFFEADATSGTSSVSLIFTQVFITSIIIIVFVQSVLLAISRLHFTGLLE